MNANQTASNLESTRLFNPSESLSHSRLRHACEEASDYLTPLLSAFLVVCMLTALTLCGWQISDSGNAQTRPGSVRRGVWKTLRGRATRFLKSVVFNLPSLPFMNIPNLPSFRPAAGDLTLRRQRAAWT